MHRGIICFEKAATDFENEACFDSLQNSILKTICDRIINLFWDERIKLFRQAEKTLSDVIIKFF